MQVSIRHTVLTLAAAVDLVGVTDVYHGRRVGIIAVECAKRMGLTRAEQRLVFDAGLLHDCGVSSTDEHAEIACTFDWCGLDTHSQRGADALASFEPLAYLAPVVREHHTDWLVLRHKGLSERETMITNLVHLADRVDSSSGRFYHDDSVLLHADEIRAQVREVSGTVFAPDVVDAFLEASLPEAFWFKLDPAYIGGYVQAMEGAVPTRVSNLAELRSFGLLIANIVDAKSHFTAEHSLGVARLVGLLGSLQGFSGDHLQMMEIAALLHDIGKLQIPDEVLESPQRLTPATRAVIKKHSYATWQILRQVGGFEELAMWAAAHHESLNGHGYPFRLTAEALPMEARIIKVADVYQALAQRRPYREPLLPRDILAELKNMEARGELDADLVLTVERNLSACQGAALGG